MEKKLEVKNLQVSFRTQDGNVKAVRDISFDLYKGETLAIVGESGSGKSVTSKAIIGILANNSIVEGGEIIYDGQDLLKISEEDFHKIRGDKISMIFQDPMSSLNPIMKVGKQLTEAMLLKGKASQASARKAFNGLLSELNKYLDLALGATKENDISKQNKETCKTFNDFCVKGAQLENRYNSVHSQTVALKLDVENLIFLISKKQKVDVTKKVKEFVKRIEKTYHRDIVQNNEETSKLIQQGLELVANKQELDLSKISLWLEDLKNLLVVSMERPKPNYFRLGYYLYKNPNVNLDQYSIEELDKLTRKALDEEFMLEFIENGVKAIDYSNKVEAEKKSKTLPLIDECINYFKGEIEKKQAYKLINELIKEVHKNINKLSIYKNSTEYSFKNSINAELSSYFNGIKNNPKALKKYEKQEVKYNKLVQKGQNPTWKLVPAVTVDLELVKSNIVKHLESLRKLYVKDIEKVTKEISKEKMISFVDFFKDQVSKLVYKTTRKMAKAKALTLLEEVGIPEPLMRYNQYPFEFSGGMRQRIVIAIALSANPDILICDEPTTALDVTIQSQILELINRIKDERNLSVIFITHDLGVVANMADRIAVMYAGKIVEYGTSEDIFYDPRHPYTWALLSSMPDLDTKEKLEAIPGTPPNMIYPPKGDAFAERNKYALEIDYEMQPPLFEVSSTHYAATWLLHPNAPKVEPPKIITERIKRMKKEAAKDGQ